MHHAGSVLPSWTTNESYSKPPTPPPPEDDHLGHYVSHVQVPAAKPETSSEYEQGQWNEQEPVANIEALEAKRRAAVREREREQAAKERHRILLAEKREAEIKRREALGRAVLETEERRAQRMIAEAKEKEQRREASIREIEEEEKSKAEEKRRQYEIERKREHALQALEMNRLREEEAQRIKRESILKKRAEMERVRDETERLYQQRKEEEMHRKVALVEQMQKKRGERLADLERRRTNPVLLQQEREFNQLIEIHAALGRLHLKTEQTQARREDVRERLLESRHLTSVLENEENQLSLSLQEVEADVKKLEGYQSSLEKLVSTRYDEAEYDPAAIKIQALYRGRKTRIECQAKADTTEAYKQKQAALIIQKRQRGVMVRRQLEDDKKARAMVHGAVKVQALVRGCQARTKVVSWKRALVLALIEKEKERLNVKSTLIQCAFRSHLAKNKFRALLLRKIKQIQRDGVQPFQPKKVLRGPGRRAGPKPAVDNNNKAKFIPRKAAVRQTFPTKPPPQVQRGEMHRIYVDGMQVPGRRADKDQVQTRFSAMGSLITHKPAPPQREVMGYSPYSQSPRRKFIPSYPTAVMADIEPQKLFNYLPVMDAGWCDKPVDKMAYWHDSAPVKPHVRTTVPAGVPYGGRALPAESMMLQI